MAVLQQKCKEYKEVHSHKGFLDLLLGQMDFKTEVLLKVFLLQETVRSPLVDGNLLKLLGGRQLFNHVLVLCCRWRVRARTCRTKPHLVQLAWARLLPRALLPRVAWRVALAWCRCRC